MKKFLAKVIGIGTAVVILMAGGLAGNAKADSGSSPTTATVGQPITFVIDSPYGLGKITYTNPITHKTNNVANDTAFTVVNVGTVHYLTYVPTPAEAGRNEVFSYTYTVDATGHLVRPVTAYVGYFHVDPAAVPVV